MSKRNGKGPQELEVVEAFKDEQLSSGVIVRVLPFPARLHDSIQSKALEKFPEPVPPKKIVKVAGGTEETDDLNDAVYLEGKDKANYQRQQWAGQRIGENVIDHCILVDVEPYQHVISKLEKSLDESAPTNPDDLKEYFLVNYALRGRADYERITTVSLALMAIGDSEVTARMDSFRREMARATNNDIKAPSLDASIGVDVVNQET